MKRIITFAIAAFFLNSARAQNLLSIPDTLSGTNFNLNIHDTSHVFFTGFVTATYGVNASYLGPTLLLNQGDSVTLNVSNGLMDTTTIHWHGLHVNAMNDGGPHMYIPPGTVWSPSFKVRDYAATYWYHPHLHMMTNLHASLGAAGMIIVRDSAEGALNLPRKYGVDDFPMVIQSKSFDAGKQILVDNAYDSIIMVNGTIDPYLPVPAQVIRLRLLNASSERVYNLGFQGGLTFHQIGTDGGLLNAPVALTRLRLAPGERGEVLLDLTGMSGLTVNMMSFASELPNAIYGAIQPGMGAGQVIPGYALNPLNGTDFNLISLQVTGATASPVTTIPLSLVTNVPWPVASADALKTLTFTAVNMGPTAIQGPFLINNASFDMAVVNYTIPMDNIEIWTLDNQSPIAHPFHIHDVQFYITELNGLPPPPHMAGRKDVVLVPAMQTVKFITRFETFCDTMGYYMYHCHMLPHEDAGMMGQFVVSCPSGVGVDELQNADDVAVFPNPASGLVRVRNNGSGLITQASVYDHAGKLILSRAGLNSSELSLDLSAQPAGMYVLKIFTDKGTHHKKISLVR